MLSIRSTDKSLIVYTHLRIEIELPLVKARRRIGKMLYFIIVSAWTGNYQIERETVLAKYIDKNEIKTM